MTACSESHKNVFRSISRRTPERIRVSKITSHTLMISRSVFKKRMQSVSFSTTANHNNARHLTLSIVFRTSQPLNLLADTFPIAPGAAANNFPKQLSGRPKTSRPTLKMQGHHRAGTSEYPDKLYSYRRADFRHECAVRPIALRKTRPRCPDGRRPVALCLSCPCPSVAAAPQHCCLSTHLASASER